MRWGIIKWEKQNGLKGKYVAERIGISDVQWSKIKSGKQRPTYDQIMKLKEEFGLENILELLKEDENEEETQRSGANTNGNVAC